MNVIRRKNIIDEIVKINKYHQTLVNQKVFLKRLIIKKIF